MKNIFILVCWMFMSCQLFGQEVKFAVGKDGIAIYKMPAVVITAKGPNRKQAQQFEKKLKKFNKLRYCILKVWPYANEAKKNLEEINRELAGVTDKKDRKKVIKSKENALFGKYEKDLRKLSITQGKILVKLIDRQTGNTTYSLIKDLKSPAAAFFWQAIGGIFGYNLKKEWDEKEADKQLEYIVLSIENGSNPTYYDYIEAKN